MSRPLRIEYEGAWYHVMNRGRRSDRVFEGREDYLLFIELMKDVAELWDVRIGAYCLIPVGKFNRVNIYPPLEDSSVGRVH